MPKYEIKTKERTDLLNLPFGMIILVDNKATIELEEHEVGELEKLGKKSGFSLSEIKPKTKKKKTNPKKGTKKTK